MTVVELWDDPIQDLENPTSNENDATASASSADGSGERRTYLTKQNFAFALIAIAAVAGVAVGVVFGLQGNGFDVASGSVPAKSSQGEEASEVDVVITSEESVEVISPGEDILTSSGEGGDALGGVVALEDIEVEENEETEPLKTENAIVPNPSNDESAKFFHAEGPLSAQVKMIDPSVVKGYESCSDLQKDIAEALKHYANKFIMDESVNSAVYENCDPNNPNWYWEYYGYDYGSYYDDDWDWGYNDENVTDVFSEQDMIVQESNRRSGKSPMMYHAKRSGNAPDLKKHGKRSGNAPDLKKHAKRSGTRVGVPNPRTRSRGARSEGIKEDSFHANNQVDGVDSADIIKSDGKHIFAAYGDVIYAWETSAGPNSGISKTIVSAEPTNDCSDYYSYGYFGYEYDYESVSHDDESGLLDEEAEQENASSPQRKHHHASDKRRANHKPRKHLSGRPRKTSEQDTCTYVSKPRVQALLLNGDRLTAIVAQDAYDYSYYNPEYTFPLTSDSTILTIQVFDIGKVPSDGSSVDRVGYKEIDGDFFAGRSVDGKALIVTSSYIDPYSIVADLYRSNDQYCGLNATEYIVKAGETVAANSDFDALAKQIMDELQLQNDCSHIFQVSMMQDSINDSGDNSKMPDSSDGNLINQFLSIITFDMTGNFDNNMAIPTQSAGAFAPGNSYLSSLYVAEDFVAAVNTGYSYDYSTGVSSTTTYILGFDTSSGVALPSCVGRVPGTMANEYSINKHNDFIQLATNEWMNWNETISKVYILSVPQDDEPKMELVGESDNLGKDGESIYAARFFGETAYIVTYVEIDPFIVMDLSDPAKPMAVGDLEVPGYSTYLHPVDIDGETYMLGIGEEWNNSTWSSSARLTLFEVSDPSSPKVAAEFLDVDSYTNAMYDFQSIRYLPNNKALIIPSVKYSYEYYENSFEGYVVYSIKADEITPLFNITQEDTFCWYEASIQARSFVFDSEITTIKGHTAMSTSMGGDKSWEYDLDEGLNYTCTEYDYSYNYNYWYGYYNFTDYDDDWWVSSKNETTVDDGGLGGNDDENGDF